ncbi:MAG TPA: hypothetical protein PLM33_11985, partial [Acidobacteriota bacterium]|nr:hypothetical protein [Acidobacteriota bacterium]
PLEKAWLTGYVGLLARFLRPTDRRVQRLKCKELQGCRRSRVSGDLRPNRALQESQNGFLGMLERWKL